MAHWTIYYAGLIAIMALALAGWMLSLVRDNVNHVGSLWGLSIGMSAFCYALFFYDLHARSWLILLLVMLWAVRLSAYLGWRDWPKSEDFRFAIHRKSNPTFFWLTSLLTIFGIQGLLAWLVSMPLFAAIENNSPLHFFDYLGASAVVVGVIIEAIADTQLVKFNRHTHNLHNVLHTGLWQFCRHPNYLGECCVWWGFFCIALGVNAWWTIISPILVTALVLINGIKQIEKHSLTHRPQYTAYMQSTPTIFPRFF